MARINNSSLRALTKPRARKNIRSGNISEKIAATVLFDTELINSLHNQEKQRIQVFGLTMISKYFEAYLDNMARANPYKYHHLYEWNRTGDKNSRLFESSIVSQNKVTLSYNFKPSIKPSDSGYIFRNKAFVMENILPMTISATDSEYLVFEVDGNFVKKKSVYVAEPGGPEVGGSFTEIFNIFMTSMADQALKEFGFFHKIEQGIMNERRIALGRISSGKIEGMALNAAKSANKIAKGLR